MPNRATPRRVFHGLLAACCSALIALAAEARQPAEPAVQPEPAAVASQSQASPRATVISFLYAMNRAEQAVGLPGADPLRRLPALFDTPIATASQIETRARMLKIFLDRVEFIRTPLIPDADEVRQQDLTRYILFPRDDRPSHGRLRELTGDRAIELIRTDDGLWKFSAETYQDIPGLFLATRNLPARFGQTDTTVTLPMFVRAVVPSSLQERSFAGVEYWQAIGLALIIFLGLALDLISRIVLRIVWTRTTERRTHAQKVDAALLKKTVRPFGVFIAAIFWFATLGLLDLNPLPLTILSVAIRFFLAVAAVLAAFRLTDLVSDYFLRKAHRTRSRFDDLLVPLLRKTTKVVLSALAAIYVAESLSIEILPLLTGLGIGGIAVAFAAKDTIENFFGSIAVILDRPFEVGDWIKVDEIEGTVEELGLRSTRIRTFYNSLITMPNSVLVRATVDNLGRRRYRRYKTVINITYDTPPDRIDAFCEGIREIVRTHPYTRTDYYHIYLNEFGPHSLDILVYMFFQTPDWPTELRERHRFILDIVRLADRLGVQFAFPTQTLHIFREEHGTAHEPHPAPGDRSETEARRAGLTAARDIMNEQPWRRSRPGAVTFGSSDPALSEGPLDTGDDDAGR